jgi:hypothetical protein
MIAFCRVAREPNLHRQDLTEVLALAMAMLVSVDPKSGPIVMFVSRQRKWASVSARTHWRCGPKATTLLSGFWAPWGSGHRRSIEAKVSVYRNGAPYTAGFFEAAALHYSVKVVCCRCPMHFQAARKRIRHSSFWPSYKTGMSGF